MGFDEVGTLTRMAACRAGIIDPALAEFRGRIFKEMGDGILAEFPSAVLALRAAISIQEKIPGLNTGRAPNKTIAFRIGVHQGEVLVQGEDLMGDGVNVAARLEPLALSGGICVSHRVREDAAGKLHLDFTDMGERMLKNIAHPVRVYQVNMLGQPVPGDSTVSNGPGLNDGIIHHLDMPPVAGLQASVQLGIKPLTIGRLAPPSDLVLPGKEVSRQHCRFEVSADGVTVTDLNSTNGTYVDDHRIEAPTRLAPGARLRIGSHMIEYRREMAEDSESTIVRAPPGREAAPN
jgi:hypothetical protein